MNTRPPAKKAKRNVVGIVGGTGGMGRLFADFFRKKGFEVLVASRRTALTPEECARASNIFILSVPIQNTSELCRRLGPLLKPGSVFMDFTSLKTFPVREMLRHSRAEVIGCHPVFGPRVASFKNQVIVLTPARGKKWLPRIQKTFRSSGAIVKISTPSEHDAMMSVVQGLMHATALTLIGTLEKRRVKLSELNDFSSPVYRIRMDFASRILNQDPELYADIALQNPSTLPVLKTYAGVLADLTKAVQRKDRPSFIRFFRKASAYLGDLKSKAEKKTDKIIDFMARN